MKPLPPDLPESLLVTEAEALGVSRAQLRGSRWSPVTYGLYRHGTAQPCLATTFRMVSRVLPDDAMAAHLTAARLLDLWLPNTPEWLPTMASLPPGRDRPERAGLYVFRSRAGQPPPVIVSGVPIVAPAVCLGQLAEDLSLLDLVIAVDCALQRNLCTRDEIIRCIRRRQRGIPRLRQALEFCDGRSESPWETILRLLHVWSGIDVQPQYVIRDQDGTPIARGDLLVKGTKRLPEYDGAVHREREQHARDLAREKLLGRLGYERYGYISSEILSSPRTIIRDAETALGLRHDWRRLERWLAEADKSSLTPEGRARLWRRLMRFQRPLRGRGERRRAQLREDG